ncbi:MAG: hypothetical protein RO257_04785 [Candidatus Kapabacteria bacterium]|nr:hypothetical protein [Candidatus Kapabacteria bacterium]
MNNVQGILLSVISITGCETTHIYKLEIGENETVWIDIPNDCSISINYLTNGKRNQEVVAGYITNSMGQKMNHNIGGYNDINF